MSSSPPSPVRTVTSAVLGFLPWILYWALLGSVPFRIALAVAVVSSLLVVAWPLVRRRRPKDFETGTGIALLVLLAVAFGSGDGALEQWIQPITNGCLFLVAVVLQLLGRPFTLPYAEGAVAAATSRTPGFRWINRVISGAWCGAFAVMTLVSAVPPVVQGRAAVQDGGSTLSVVCYWIVPCAVLGLVGTASSLFPGWFVGRLAQRQADDDRRVEAVQRPDPDAAPGFPPASVAGLSIRLDQADSPATGALRVHVAPDDPGATVRVGVCDAFGVWWWAGRRSDTALGATDLAPVLATASPIPGGVPPRVFAPPPVAELAVEIRTPDGRGVAARGTRSLSRAAVRRDDVLVDGRPGRLFHPDPAAATGPGFRGAERAAVALFPGSEGGLDSQSAHAAVLADLGFVTLVYATTDEGSTVAEVPLERYGAAIRYLADRPEVDPGRVAAMSISKGAEGLLAAAAACRLNLCGLVLVSPSDAVWQAVGPDGPLPGTSSWTVAGAALPFRAVDGEALMPQLIRSAARSRRRPSLPLRLRPAYRLDDRSGASSDPGAIDVAAVEVPLLLVAGDADELWPSARMSRRIAARRTAQDRDEYLIRPGAGHLITFPYGPVADRSDGIAFGGTVGATAAASTDFYRAAVDFLSRCTGLSGRVGPGFPFSTRRVPPGFHPGVEVLERDSGEA